MSKNRHCDRHDGDFSERLEDWSELRMTIHSRYQDSTPRDVVESLDLCPPCTKIMRGVQGVSDPLSLPVQALTSTAHAMDVSSAYPAAYGYGRGKQEGIDSRVKTMRVDPEEYQRYMHWLETQALQDDKTETLERDSQRDFGDGPVMVLPGEDIPGLDQELHHPRQTYPQ